MTTVPTSSSGSEATTATSALSHASRRLRDAFAVAIAILLSACVRDAGGTSTGELAHRYPHTERSETIHAALHGVDVADPYRWLEDGQSSAVKSWSNAQNALARSVIGRLPGRAALAARLTKLLSVERMGVPIRSGGRRFYLHQGADRETETLSWSSENDPRETVLLDPATWQSDHAALGEWSPSPNGTKVVYAVHPDNGDEASLHVVDVASGQPSRVDVLPDVGLDAVSWAPSSDRFYYAHLPPNVHDGKRMAREDLRVHVLGTDPAHDRVVRGPMGDAQAYLSSRASSDGHWLLEVIHHAWRSTDVYYADLRAPELQWTTLVAGRNARFEVVEDADRFFALTDDDAPNGRVIAIDPAHPDPGSWKEIVHERADAILDSLTAVDHALALGVLVDAVRVTELRTEEGDLTRSLTAPALASVGRIAGTANDPLMYYSVESFTGPTEIWEEDVDTGRRRSVFKLDEPFDPSRWTAERIEARSKDGTAVRAFMIHAKDAPRNGSNPTMVEGYGGFGISELPAFRPALFPWLESGGTWVVVNARGGGEYGAEWHQHGTRREKQHSFDDFIAVAEELVRQGFTRPEKLAMTGFSNGGLLVGAVMTQRPDLFRAAICDSPLADMVRYPLFGSGAHFVDEYGSPSDLADFKALYAYSPYHRVVPGVRYPALLLLVGERDDRVDAMHARKLAAAMQWASSGGPVLLRIEAHAGHSGAATSTSTVDRLADAYAFALDAMR